MFVINRVRDKILVSSKYWEISHDILHGGIINEIRIINGTNTNLLIRPIEIVIDKYSESYEREPEFDIQEFKNLLTLRFAGYLYDEKGNNSYIRFSHTYEYHLYFIRILIELIPEKIKRINNMSVFSTSFNPSLDEYCWGSTNWELIKPRYMHIVGPHYDDIWGKIPADVGIIHCDTTRPWQVTLFKRGVEGFQWCGDSKEYIWNKPIEGAKTEYRLSREKDGVKIDFSPVKESNINWEIPLNFSYYLILPNIPELGNKKYYEIAIDSFPFPSYEQLKVWHGCGVNLLRIHEGTDWRNKSNNFWHDGEFPPYSPSKMKELADFIDNCHRLGMKVIPYFSGWELSPETEVFAKHWKEWYAPTFPNGKVRYTPSPGAGVYGALMCPDSEWSDFLESYIKKCVEVLNFDGFYFDWSGPGPCANYDHLPGEHNGTDGLVKILGNLRNWLGANGIIVIHSGGQSMWLLHHNIADQIVTLEEGKKSGGYTPETIEEYPPSVLFIPATSVSIVPNILYGTEKDKPPRYRLYRGLAHLVLLNALPYSYSWAENLGFNYKNWNESVDDPKGLYQTFALYSRYDWSRYKFFHGLSNVAIAEDPKVKAALYATYGEGILVVSNLCEDPAGSGIIYIREDIASRFSIKRKCHYPSLEGFEFKLIPF